MSHFLPLDVVDRGRETQLQVGENLNYSMSRFKDLKIYIKAHLPDDNL